MRLWRGDRVVEGTGLENRQGGNVFEGSNPSLSAIILTNKIVYSARINDFLYKK